MLGLWAVKKKRQKKFSCAVVYLVYIENTSVNFRHAQKAQILCQIFMDFFAEESAVMRALVFISQTMKRRKVILYSNLFLCCVADLYFSSSSLTYIENLIFRRHNLLHIFNVYIPPYSVSICLYSCSIHSQFSNGSFK